MRKVYRLEHSERQYGPFVGYFSLSLSTDDRKAWYAVTQSTQREFTLPDNNWRYGCAQRESVIEYFGAFYPKLVKAGYVVREYCVPCENIIDGTRELIFRVS